MVKQDFNVERTRAGLQFMIPGTEKPVPRPRMKFAHDGNQLVIPGAERISEKVLVDRMLKKPLRPRSSQRGLSGTSLFGSVRKK